MTLGVICNSKIPADIKSIARAESSATWKCSLDVLQLGLLNSEMDLFQRTSRALTHTVFSTVLFELAESETLALNLVLIITS